ncbi:hypothetical protein AV540_00040 [Brevibacillus parabrevis]|uniref:putative phage tail protein n=1 Tax=Brevibacillus parabrevis TaxID=54914 RepID=UPI0007AB51B0|nr:putative phage tail protein [Brevibacillus parabrevis]KZE55778.1 hypothetical protein AV540_00040 [Brevibacillus parabrevis]
MIPERYRQMLPPQWYENKVAEYHFEGTATAVDAFAAEREDVLRQFHPWTATWGLDVWDWIYFGQKQLLGVEERRKNIRQKHWARLPFTLATLKTMGQSAGKLESVKEDFENKEIIFEYSGIGPVQLVDLSRNFEEIRPVHVNGSKAIVRSKRESILVSAFARSFDAEYPICGLFYAEDDLEGRIFKESMAIQEIARTSPVNYPLTDTFYPVPE